MTEREANELAWRAFQLGARVAMTTQGIAQSPGAQTNYLAMLYAISQGDATVNEPGDSAARYPEMAETFIRLGNAAILCDQALAKSVWAGFDNAAQQIIDS